MSQCIIHIGMHKTGSTSIQVSLQGFEDARFVYATLGADANHSLPIYSLFAPQPDRHHIHLSTGRAGADLQAYIDQVWRDIGRSIAKTERRTMLMSGEDIGFLSRSVLAKLYQYLKAQFDEIAVVGYVRPPAAYLTSHFQQRVKDGSIRGLDAEQMYRNYRESFEKFDEVFGRDRVRLWKFDPTTFPDGCVVQDFCSRLEISFPKGRIFRLNEPISRQAVALLYTYSRIGETHGWNSIFGPEATKLAALVGSDRFRFSPDVVRPVLDKNRADIEWMEARLGQSLQEDLGELQSGDVREERDLLRPDPSTVNRLLDLLGAAAPKGVRGKTPEDVALLVHALREKYLAANGSKRPGRRRAHNRPGNRRKQDLDRPGKMMRSNQKPLNSSPHPGPQVPNVFTPIIETLRRWKKWWERGATGQMRVLLHIGMMKTGTSSIQRSLAGFENENFIWYQDHKNRANHNLDVFGFIGAERPGYGRPKKLPEVEARDHFASFAPRIGSRTLILSGEDMRLLTADQVKQVAEFFRSHGATAVEAIGYVRPPVGYITSLSRATEGGRLRNLGLFKRRVLYRDGFEQFDHGLGRENVHLRKFDPARFPEGCVVQDFCAWVGIPCPLVVRENEPLSRDAVAILYAKNKESELDDAHHARLAREMATIGGPKFRFSPDLIRPFLDANREDIEWMEARLGESLDEDWQEHLPDDVRTEDDLRVPAIVLRKTSLQRGATGQMRVLLHIGMMKTGTTSIQRSLAGFENDNVIWYQDRKNRINQTRDIFSFIGAEQRPFHGQGAGQPPEVEARDHFASFAPRIGSRTLIVSGEGMGLLTADQVKQVAEFFRDHGACAVEVIGYVRPPVGYITSLSRATNGRGLIDLSLSERRVPYRNWFEQFDHGLGRENVHLRKFDPAKFPEGCVVHDFCAFLGIPCPPVVRANPSLPRDAVAILYAKHKETRMDPAQRVRLARELAKIGGPKFRFSPDLIRPFLDANREEIEWMEARLGESLDEDWQEHLLDDVRTEDDLRAPAIVLTKK